MKRCQNLGGRRNALDGIGSPKYLVNDAKKRLWLFALIQDSFQGFDLHNEIALSAFYIIPKSHGCHHLQKRCPVRRAGAGSKSLGQNAVHCHIFQEGGLAGCVGASHKGSAGYLEAVGNRLCK